MFANILDFCCARQTHPVQMPGGTKCSGPSVSASDNDFTLDNAKFAAAMNARIKDLVYNVYVEPMITTTQHITKLYNNYEHHQRNVFVISSSHTYLIANVFTQSLTCTCAAAQLNTQQSERNVSDLRTIFNNIWIPVLNEGAHLHFFMNLCGTPLTCHALPLRMHAKDGIVIGGILIVTRLGHSEERGPEYLNVLEILRSRASTDVVFPSLSFSSSSHTNDGHTGNGIEEEVTDMVDVSTSILFSNSTIKNKAA